MMGFSEGMDLLIYMGLSGLLKYYIFYQWKDRRPSNAKLAGTVTGLHLYPFKSALGLQQREITCNSNKGPSNGHVADRHWMVITDKHEMISSREEPLISRIVPRMERPDSPVMILSAPGSDDLTLDPRQVEQAADVISTDVHTVPTQGLDCGDAASKWISKYLGKTGYRLVYSGSNIYTRGVIGGNKKYLPWTRIAKPEDKISGHFPNVTFIFLSEGGSHVGFDTFMSLTELAFHDSISLHLCAEESMSDLNSRLKYPLEVLRFRPTIIVQTGSKPYAEDTWKEIFVGDVRLRTLKLCARCVLPNIDPKTGVKDINNEPLKALSGYRSFLGGILGPAFGIDLIVERPGTIRVGDPIFVIEGDNIAKP